MSLTTRRGLPLARARNLAASQARCEQMIFLDVDCIPAQDLVGRLGAALAAEDALICADVRYLAAGQPGPSWTETDLLAAGEPHPVRQFPAVGLRREPNPGLFWSLAFGMRRSTFLGLGGFDERFTGYGAEDTDFGFRAEAAGLSLLFLGGAGAYHQHHLVCDPPLQHFDDIVENATRFHAIWGVWPMEGWLRGFAELGLIKCSPGRIDRIRRPTAQELSDARKPSEARF